MKVELKKAKGEDFREIAKIYSEEFSKQPYNEPWTEEKALNKIEIFSRYCDIWKILYEKDLVGFIIINPNQWCPGEIAFGEEMAIKSKFQKKGIGTKTLEIVFEEYEKRGFKKMMGILNKKSKVRNLYNRIGLKESMEDTIIVRSLK